MVAQAESGAPAESANPGRLGLLLAMAMFVLVVDTSLMNVSISAVVADLNTTVSGVQSAIALEALVSAAFILISSKIGDLIGRKRAYVLGLLGYAVGALGDGARPGPPGGHRLLGDPRRARRLAPAAGDAVAHPRQLRGRGAEAGLRPRRRRGRRSRPRSARSLGGFITTFLSWRVGFAARARRHRHRPAGIGLVKDVAVHRRPRHRPRRRRPSRSSAWAASSSASSSGRRAARPSVALIAIGAISLGARWPGGSSAASARGEARSHRSRTLFGSKPFRLGDHPARCCSRSRSAG